MKIGIDFDNTIVCYDKVFYQAALEKNLIPETLSTSKSAVRDYLRSIGKENEWTELQGYVYGKRMDLAKPYVGLETFFSKIKKSSIDVVIISHKTKFPYLGPKYNLHLSAKNWLKKQTFFSLSLPIYFSLTLEEKLKKIETEKCDYFIDDLPELLEEKTFPKTVKKILFDPYCQQKKNSSYKTCSSWEEICKFLCIP